MLITWCYNLLQAVIMVMRVILHSVLNGGNKSILPLMRMSEMSFSTSRKKQREVNWKAPDEGEQQLFEYIWSAPVSR